MRPHPLTLLATLSLLLPIPAAAQRRWKEIGKTSTGNAVYVDPKSVTTAAGIVTATLRVQFTEPVSTPKGPITSSRTTAMFDCAKKVVAVKENTFYHNERANRVYEHKVIGKPGYGPAIVGTLPDIALKHLCAN
jgi:hypothetical protein